MNARFADVLEVPITLAPASLASCVPPMPEKSWIRNAFGNFRFS